MSTQHFELNTDQIRLIQNALSYQVENSVYDTEEERSAQMELFAMMVLSGGTAPANEHESKMEIEVYVDHEKGFIQLVKSGTSEIIRFGILDAWMLLKDAFKNSKVYSTPMTEKDALNSFEDAARPLIKWLAENKQFMAKAIVTSTSCELLEGVMGSPKILDYIED